MLTIPRSVRVFAWRKPVCLALGIDGLAQLVRDGLRVSPFTGNIYCFFNRSRDRVKLLIWDRNGFWLLCKRLERGRFEQVSGRSSWVEIGREQLVHLLEGIDTRTSRFRHNFAREVRIAPREEHRSRLTAQ